MSPQRGSNGATQCLKVELPPSLLGAHRTPLFSGSSWSLMCWITFSSWSVGSDSRSVAAYWSRSTNLRINAVILFTLLIPLIWSSIIAGSQKKLRSVKSRYSAANGITQSKF